MRAIRGLRAQLAAGAALLGLLVVAIAGGILAWQLEQQDRSDTDSALLERSDRIGADVDKMLSDEGHGGESTDPYGDLLGGSESLVRLFVGDQLVAQRGELPATDDSIPHSAGFTTVDIDGEQWRSFVRESGGAQLQVLQSLAPIAERRDRNLVLIAWVTLGATVLGALGGWLLAARLLRPLERLRVAAVTLRDDRESDDGLPAVRGPVEVSDLASTLNALLDRLRSSTNSARRFTADAGHELRNPLTSIGAYVEALERAPDDAAHRAHIVAAMRTEYNRVVSLLDGLQALARGDAGVLPAHDEIDLAELVGDAVSDAGRLHPEIRFVLGSLDDARVTGWRDGVHGAIDNLLENAALHGRPSGTVTVELRARPEDVLLTVSDDGPGIAPDLRADMLRRFVRGERTRSDGSGLGLALVAQQAELNGGEFALGASPSGGLLATLRLPTRGRDSGVD